MCLRDGTACPKSEALSSERGFQTQAYGTPGSDWGGGGICSGFCLGQGEQLVPQPRALS